ncbi:MAG TPA: HAD family hydrolase [Azospirillaceae bacterium]|nr:HAD family hydrolase [Azospirillaceae bacterium]
MSARALFLDRDGVINVDYGYVGDLERFVFMDGVFDLCRAAVGRGFRLAVVTNQSGVARGYYDMSAVSRLHAAMERAFIEAGAPLTAVAVCPFLRGGSVPDYARDSYWRKPNPGMILETARRFGLDPARSALIGDSATDMRAARAAGIGLRLRLAPAGTEDPDADFVAPDLRQAAARLFAA